MSPRRGPHGMKDVVMTEISQAARDDQVTHAVPWLRPSSSGSLHGKTRRKDERTSRTSFENGPICSAS
eukprot:12914507-Prorocentrum_lima.AAC.1